MTGINRGSTRPRLIAAVIGAAALPLLLGGCFNGFSAQTSIQPPSGDGLNTQVGNVLVRNAVWVRSKNDPSTMTLSATFVNVGKTPDSLMSISTDPKAFVVGITEGAIKLEPLSETRTAFNSETYVNGFGINVPPSGWVQTTFVFKVAGTVTGSVITVPTEGIYAEISPSLPPQSSPSAQPTASPSPDVSIPATPTGRPTGSPTPSPTR